MAVSMPASISAANPGRVALWHFYERLDRIRKGQGQWLERLGWGPVRTPSRVVLQQPGLILRGYAGAAAEGMPVLLVPAPIKRAYIWDLAPGASVVQACLRHGLRPYLVEWQEPEPGFGLDEYADSFLSECLAAIRRECGERPPVVAGHSLGGILAAIFAALHPESVGALVLLAAPLHCSYSKVEGGLGPMIRAVEQRGLLEALPGRMPGSSLSQAGFLASPAAFAQERWQDWVRSLPAAAAVRTHLQVERWSLDELPLARKLVAELAGKLWRGDAFMRGTLRIGRRRAAAAAVRAPLLVVADRGCPVVPPAAILPFYEAAGSSTKALLWYEGDVGVAIRHIGPLVGRNAHAHLWPQILDWVAGLKV